MSNDKVIQRLKDIAAEQAMVAGHLRNDVIMPLMQIDQVDPDGHDRIRKASDAAERSLAGLRHCIAVEIGKRVLPEALND